MMRKVGIGLWCCVVLFFIAFAMVSTTSARHIVFVSGHKMALPAGRSLKVVTDDYEPSANRGHEPRYKAGRRTLEMP
ncbi:hypothetical protein FRX31_028824 [Thalictrum thalictroides]|uniref:Transmembrane protein n=1 Tax=Thalictrum thalictroides TaxID=46969 RepID=A0A7J6VB48_THATH|nr:hypothetical protein FRX31_028824 [Thalictrum thalictroides]